MASFTLPQLNINARHLPVISISRSQLSFTHTLRGTACTIVSKKDGAVTLPQRATVVAQAYNNRNDDDSRDDRFQERVVQVRRVTKVVKGGKQLSFRAVVSKMLKSPDIDCLSLIVVVVFSSFSPIPSHPSLFALYYRSLSVMKPELSVSDAPLQRKSFLPSKKQSSTLNATSSLSLSAKITPSLTALKVSLDRLVSCSAQPQKVQVSLLVVQFVSCWNWLA